MIGVPQFPLVDRELIQAGRNVQTYLGRSYLAVIVMVIIALVWWGNAHYELKLLDTEPERIGRYFAWLAMFFQFAVVILAAPAIALPLIIREKEERTLPLLLLTGRRHWDVVAAKYVSVLLRVTMLILTILPLQALAALFGGVNVVGLAVQSVLMILLACAVCALALYFSTICKTTAVGIALVYFMLALWFVATFALDYVLPMAGRLYHTNLFNAIPWVAFYGRLGSSYYPALAVTAGVAAWALWRAAYFLPRQVLLAPVARPRARRRRPRLGMTELCRLVTTGADGLGMSDRSRWVQLLAFLGLCAAVQVPFLGWAVLIVVYVWSTTRGLGRLRLNGALDEILLTPQSDRAVVNALILGALARSGFVVVPLLFAFSGLTSFGLDLPITSNLFRSPALHWSLLGLVLLQLVACSSIAAYVSTLSRPLRSLERYANLAYLVGVLIPFLIPYLVVAILALLRHDYDSAAYDSWFDNPVRTIAWAAAVSSVAGFVAYTRAVVQIRARVCTGPPSIREHPLLALLRP